MKITNAQVFGLESAVRACRNPKNSWDKSDSLLDYDEVILDIDIKNDNDEGFILGQADKKLSQQLTRAGGEHCKHLRLIQVWFDMKAPRYLWQELDTYKHAEKVSCSTMHKLFDDLRKIELQDFSYDEKDKDILTVIIARLNELRCQYLVSKDKELLIRAKKILPEGFLQTRTVNTNYQQLLNIYNQRKGHRLLEWKEFCRFVEHLPYFLELTNLKGDVE